MLGWKEPGVGLRRQKLHCDPEVSHPPELQGFHLEARMTIPTQTISHRNVRSVS